MNTSLTGFKPLVFITLIILIFLKKIDNPRFNHFHYDSNIFIIILNNKWTRFTLISWWTIQINRYRVMSWTSLTINVIQLNSSGIDRNRIATLRSPNGFSRRKKKKKKCSLIFSRARNKKCLEIGDKIDNCPVPLCEFGLYARHSLSCRRKSKKKTNVLGKLNRPPAGMYNALVTCWTILLLFRYNTFGVQLHCCTRTRHSRSCRIGWKQTAFPFIIYTKRYTISK